MICYQPGPGPQNAGPGGPQPYGMGGPGPGGPQQHFGGQNWQQAPGPGGFQQPWQNQPHPQDPSMYYTCSFDCLQKLFYIILLFDFKLVLYNYYIVLRLRSILGYYITDWVLFFNMYNLMFSLISY